MLIKAAESGGKAAADGGAESIGNVNAGAGANANADAVKGIAGAMKGIVEAARKVEGVKFEPAAAAAAGGNGNKKAGKLFGTNAAAAAEDAKDAAAAVGAVSGEQILSAIVAAAGSSDQAQGKTADQATNAIEAAIGGGAGAAEFGNDMKKKNDQIAAALVLRGIAKGGKFASAAGEASKEVKAVVESAVVKTC